MDIKELVKSVLIDTLNEKKFERTALETFIESLRYRAINGEAWASRLLVDLIRFVSEDGDTDTEKSITVKYIKDDDLKELKKLKKNK